MFCVHSIIQWRPKQCFLLHRENSLAKKDKKRKERNTKTNKMFTSPLFFLLGLYTLNMGPFFFSPLKILFLFFFEIDARLSVSRFDYTNAKRASKNDSSARLTPAPTKRTREREKHARTHTHTHRRTWANASRKRRLRKKSSLNWTRRLRARSAITRNRSPRNSIFNSIRGWWSARCAGKNTRARSTIYRRPSTCIRIGSTRARD